MAQISINDGVLTIDGVSAHIVAHFDSRSYNAEITQGSLERDSDFTDR